MSDHGDAPGPLLASGRAADVYDLGDGTVLRRYRRAGHDLDYEAKVMRHVAAAGVRVPGVVSVEGDTDLVMERIDGPTMLDDLSERQWMLLFHARRLARLQADLAGVEAPSWMLAPGTPKGSGAASVLHLDLHPMNVLLARDGPVIIDWTNAAGGPPGFDAALSYVEIVTSHVATNEIGSGEAETGTSGGTADETGAGTGRTDGRSVLGRGPNLDRLGQKLFAGSFRRARGRRLVDGFMVAACDHRLADRGVTPDERVRVAELRKRAIARRTRQ